MAASVGQHHFLMRLDDQKPGGNGKQRDDRDCNDRDGPNGPSRTVARMKCVSGIHDLSLSGIRYPRFFPP